MGAQVVGTDNLHVAGGSQQYEENGHDTEPGIPDGFVHLGSPAPIGLPGTAAPAPNPEALTIGPDCMGRFAMSEINNIRPTIIQFANSEDPPAAMNGVVRPVSGMTRRTPPTTTKIWMAIAHAMPAAKSLPKASRAESPMRMIRVIRMKNNSRMAARPTRPSSSPKDATIMSEFAAKTKSGRPWPSPEPNIPPDANPNKP